MKRGIASPWVEREQAPVDPLEGAKAGTQPVRFAGRHYTFVVALPFVIDEVRAVGIAAQTFGECLLALKELTPRLERELAAQRLSLTDRPMGPCVSLDFGVTPLYAVASSSNEALAQAMAVDRLATALSVLLATEPSSRGILAAHHLSLLRNP